MADGNGWRPHVLLVDDEATGTLGLQPQSPAVKPFTSKCRPCP